jgi:hypothetical protein
MNPKVVLGSLMGLSLRSLNLGTIPLIDLGLMGGRRYIAQTTW